MIKPRIGLVRETLGQRIAGRLKPPKTFRLVAHRSVRDGYPEVAPSLVWHFGQRRVMPGKLHHLQRMMEHRRRTPFSPSAPAEHEGPLPRPWIPAAGSEPVGTRRPPVRPASHLFGRRAAQPTSTTRDAAPFVSATESEHSPATSGSGKPGFEKVQSRSTGPAPEAARDGEVPTPRAPRSSPTVQRESAETPTASPAEAGLGRPASADTSLAPTELVSRPPGAPKVLQKPALARQIVDQLRAVVPTASLTSAIQRMRAPIGLTEAPVPLRRPTRSWRPATRGRSAAEQSKPRARRAIDLQIMFLTNSLSASAKIGPNVKIFF
jgi:hypothetical protein